MKNEMQSHCIKKVGDCPNGIPPGLHSVRNDENSVEHCE